jgi:hypothetical protein
MMKKGQSIMAALLLLSSALFATSAVVFLIFGNSPPLDMDNLYLNVQETKSKSVKLECKKEIQLTEILRKGYNRHRCKVGSTITLDNDALYITVRVPQGQLLIDLGKEE